MNKEKQGETVLYCICKVLPFKSFKVENEKLSMRANKMKPNIVANVNCGLVAASKIPLTNSTSQLFRRGGKTPDLEASRLLINLVSRRRRKQ